MAGRLGLELARQHHPDVILLDLHLPDVPGEDVLRAVPVDPGLHGTAVIVVSADATSRQIERLLDAGADHYLTKPIEVPRILELIDRILAAKHRPA